MCYRQKYRIAIFYFFIFMENSGKSEELTSTVKYCQDETAEQSKDASKPLHYTNQTVVNPREGCCTEDIILCVTFDPCLSNKVLESYRGFLSGSEIHPKYIIPFHSKGLFESENLNYNITFITIGDDLIEVSVLNKSNSNKFILKALFKIAQTDHCILFSFYNSRLTRSDTNFFIMMFTVSVIVGYFLMISFSLFEYFVLINNSMTQNHCSDL
ncbi:hypothetical protein HZS_4880 [Henneguya salminicola]|nr:hypothetical protein HZS_4880 [Henneguya salminicola]